MAATPAAALPHAKNDRVQDLFLLAKGYYHGHDARNIAEHARRVVGYHNLYDISRMSLRDTAWVVVNDLFPLVVNRLAAHAAPERGTVETFERFKGECIHPRRPQRALPRRLGMTDFLMSLGPHPMSLGPHPVRGHGDHADGYFAGLIEAVLEQMLWVRLRSDNGLWALPFPRPEVDPALAELVVSSSPDLLYRPKG